MENSHSLEFQTQLVKHAMHNVAKKYLPIFFVATILFSCKKDNNTLPSSTVLNISSVIYQWGDLDINKKYVLDLIKYSSSVKIDSVISYNDRGKVIERIGFIYSGTDLTLSTSLKDKYKLDNQGRVILHTTEEIQNGIIMSTQTFSYDSNGYLSKVTMSLNLDGNPNIIFSVINYEVKNGNYVKYTLSNTEDGLITRQYNFYYNTAVKVTSPVSLFSPIFSGNTTSNIDKYLNYGKNSVNLLRNVDYIINNLDKTVSKGSFTVEGKVNADNYITQLNLNGTSLTGFPSDNLSPLPRSIWFTFTK